MLLILVAVLAVMLSGREADAQAPNPAVVATQTDLGTRMGADPASVAVVRLDAVIRSDGDTAFRYHADRSAVSLRLVDSMILLSQAPVMPLAQGAVAASALDRFLDHLGDAGFAEIVVQELAVLRDWIPGAFSPHYIVGGATLEIFMVPTIADVDAAVDRLRDSGSDAELGEDQSLWRYEELLIVLLQSSVRSAVREAISDLIGPPLVTTLRGEPQRRPSRVSLDSAVSLVLEALKLAGFDAVTSGVAVNRSFLPPSTLSGVVRVGEINVEFFALVDSGAVDEAVRGVAAAPDLVGSATIWTSGSTLVLAPGEDPAIHAVIRTVFGAPNLVGDAVTMPAPPPGEIDGGSPIPRPPPVTGNGGVVDDDDETETPDWVWGGIAGVAVAMVAAGGGYRLWLCGRSRLRRWVVGVLMRFVADPRSGPEWRLSCPLTAARFLRWLRFERTDDDHNDPRRGAVPRERTASDPRASDGGAACR